MTSETYLPRIGGAELHVYNIAKELVTTGHSIHLVTNEESNEPEVLECESFKVTRIPWRRNFFSAWKCLWSSAKEVDVIHAHYSYRLAAMGGLVALLQRKPIIVVLHGMGILSHPNVRFSVRLKLLLYRFLALKLADKVISTSQDLANIAYKYIPQDKVQIIINGFDKSIFDFSLSPTDKGNKKILLTVRRLVPKNGVQFIIEAMPRVLEKEPDALLVVVGDGPLLPYIKSRVNDLKIERFVKFEGFKSSPEVARFLAESDVVIFPSTAESASLACLEAMAMKKNIVASRVGGLIELLGKNSERGKLVDIVTWQSSNYDAPLQIDKEANIALADAIVEASQDIEVNLVRAQRAFKYATDNFSWDKIAKETELVYKEVMK